MILILTRFAHDATVARVCQVLDQQGAETLVLAPSMIEQHAAVEIANDGHGGGRSILRLNDRVIDLARVDAAWLWRSWRPHQYDPRYRDLREQHDQWRFFENEWVAFYKGFSMTLAANGVFCVNPPPLNNAWEEKCAQLWHAAQVGLRIPPTLYTTRLPAAHRFYHEHHEEIIYKPFRAYIRVEEGTGDEGARAVKLLTNRVHADDLMETDGFLPTPSIFQPYVPKQFELRIVVVGRQLFACAIHSQQSERSRDDWRRFDFEHTPYEPYLVPDSIAEKLLNLMERLGLVFGSIDMIVTPDGEYIFLEINPNGQFDWIARLTGLPIYEHLAAMLVAGKVNYAANAVREVPDAR